jgi:hypothetical protein
MIIGIIIEVMRVKEILGNRFSDMLKSSPKSEGNQQKIKREKIFDFF